VKKSLAPTWNEEFKFYIPKLKGHLFIKVWDKDSKSDSDVVIGEACIQLDSLKKDQSDIKGWFPLETGTGEDKKTLDKSR